MHGSVGTFPYHRGVEDKYVKESIDTIICCLYVMEKQLKQIIRNRYKRQILHRTLCKKQSYYLKRRDSISAITSRRLFDVVVGVGSVEETL